uniref:Uncharacterized protein n=1 Tax=Anopheles braziliensis TaxID=58242 RepID=A0A2M3ZLD8_9DIPT
MLATLAVTIARATVPITMPPVVSARDRLRSTSRCRTTNSHRKVSWWSVKADCTPPNRYRHLSSEFINALSSPPGPFQHIPMHPSFKPPAHALVQRSLEATLDRG